MPFLFSLLGFTLGAICAVCVLYQISKAT